MLKLIRIRKWHIPNALAVAAAFLLVATSLAGVERPANPTDATIALAQAQENVVHQPGAGPQPLTQTTPKQTHKFRVKLFLFRH